MGQIQSIARAGQAVITCLTCNLSLPLLFNHKYHIILLQVNLSVNLLGTGWHTLSTYTTPDIMLGIRGVQSEHLDMVMFSWNLTSSRETHREVFNLCSVPFPQVKTQTPASKGFNVYIENY